ncbi:uncharacterized protein [Rutidosis leptorrhynchoides]|uniref:uncharacterized protein n=1 Tax=Rutidosis leptorrhynchoides TaxID=125765 RepID=UPI003A99084B
MSLVYGLGVNKIEVEGMANRVNCKAGELPFTYLGLPIGRNMNRIENWSPVLEKFSSKLAEWKARTGDKSKLIWIKWDDTLLPYGEGGLNIGSLRGKNLSLLGKWFWRAQCEPNALWVSVIKSIHGFNGILPSSGLNNLKGKGGVWANILRAGTSIDKLGIDFRAPLKERYKRLFFLESNQQVNVKDRVQWSEVRCIFSWNWVRALTGCASSDMQQLLFEISSYAKEDTSRDKWVWSLASNGIFTTKKLSKLIDEQLF